MKRFFSVNTRPYPTVYAFDSRATRDAFVSAHPTNSIHAILKKEIKNYLDAPAPFSTQARMIDGYITEALDIHGLQGQVTVDYTDAPGMTRLD